MKLDFPIFSAVGATITWTLPPLGYPVAAGDTNTRTTTQWFAQDSSELHLKWEFTLGGGASLHEVTWEKNNQQIGRKTASGEVTISSQLKNDFNISLSDLATLIVYNVRAADEEIFTCKVESKAFGVWKDNIEVRTYGEYYFYLPFCMLKHSVWAATQCFVGISCF